MLPVDKKRAYTYMVWPTTRPGHILVCPVCTVCNRTDGTDDQGTIRYSAYWYRASHRPQMSSAISVTGITSAERCNSPPVRHNIV